MLTCLYRKFKTSKFEGCKSNIKNSMVLLFTMNKLAKINIKNNIVNNSIKKRLLIQECRVFLCATYEQMDIYIKEKYR